MWNVSDASIARVDDDRRRVGVDGGVGVRMRTSAAGDSAGEGVSGQCWCCWETTSTKQDPLIRSCRGCLDKDLQLVHQSCIDAYINNLPVPTSELHLQLPPHLFSTLDMAHLRHTTLSHRSWQSLTFQWLISTLSTTTMLPRGRRRSLKKLRRASRQWADTTELPANMTSSITTNSAIHQEAENWDQLSSPPNHALRCTRCTDLYHIIHLPVPVSHVLKHCPSTRKSLMFVTLCFIYITLLHLMLLGSVRSTENSWNKELAAERLREEAIIPLQPIPEAVVAHHYVPHPKYARAVVDDDTAPNGPVKPPPPLPKIDRPIARLPPHHPMSKAPEPVMPSLPPPNPVDNSEQLPPPTPARPHKKNSQAASYYSDKAAASGSKNTQRTIVASSRSNVSAEDDDGPLEMTVLIKIGDVSIEIQLAKLLNRLWFASLLWYLISIGLLLWNASKFRVKTVLDVDKVSLLLQELDDEGENV